MSKDGITFDELRELLQEVGFRESLEETTRTRFEHPTTGTILLFRRHGREDIVSDREIHVVRRQLIDNGLMEPTAFDRFLQKASA